MTETQMLVLAILAVILIVVGAWLLLRKRQSTTDPAAGVEAQPESVSEIPVLAEPALQAETAAELDGHRQRHRLPPARRDLALSHGTAAGAGPPPGRAERSASASPRKTE